MIRAAGSPGTKSRRAALSCIALIWVGLGIALSPVAASAEIELADTPMFTRVLPPPANIMFLLDDSGSMNFEFMVKGGFDGSFNPIDPTVRGYCYLFDDLGDNMYSQTTYSSWYAGSEGRKYWKTQYFNTNVMFYNPNVTYAPWPSYGSVEYNDADKDNPQSHPNNSSIKIYLENTSYTVGAINVPHSRYVLYDPAANKKYLTILDKGTSTKKYFEISTTVVGIEEKISALTPLGSLPAGLDSSRDYHAERQNFANWFTYHRRREFTAKNALASIIKSLA